MGDGDVTRIDRQAWAWRKKLIEARCGLGRHAAKRNVAGLFVRHGMPNGPLPHDRLDLIQMATRREQPSRESFVTLALVEYIEDQETLPSDERTAKLPYQLAWVRAGFSLIERTGLPGGIAKATWPDVEPGALVTPTRQPVLPGERNSVLRPLRVDGHPDLPGRPEPEADPVAGTAGRAAPTPDPQEFLPGLGLDVVPSVPKGRRGAYGDPSTA